MQDGGEDEAECDEEEWERGGWGGAVLHDGNHDPHEHSHHQQGVEHTEQLGSLDWIRAWTKRRNNTFDDSDSLTDFDDADTLEKNTSLEENKNSKKQKKFKVDVGTLSLPVDTNEQLEESKLSPIKNKALSSFS